MLPDQPACPACPAAAHGVVVVMVVMVVVVVLLLLLGWARGRGSLMHVLAWCTAVPQSVTSSILGAAPS